MSKNKFAVVSTLGVVVLLLAGSVAQAQVKRAWVKAGSTGADDPAGIDLGNTTCSFTSPCRTFQKAHNVATGQSEVDAITSGDYSNARSDDPAISGGTQTLTITHSITISGNGNLVSLSGGDVTPSTPFNGVVVTLPSSSDVAELDGITINGFHQGGTVGPSVTDGVVFNGDGSLVLNHTDVSNFSSAGIRFIPTGSSPAGLIAGDLYMRDCQLTNNEQVGMFIQSQNTNSARGSLENVRFNNNGRFGSGVGLQAGARAVVNVSSSVASGNGLSNFQAQGTGAGNAEMNITETYSNGSFNGVASLNFGGTANVRLANDDIFDNGAAFGLGAGCQIASFGNNRIAGNNANNGPPTTTLPVQ